MMEIKFRAYQPEAKGDLKWWSWQELRESDLNTIFRHPEKYHLMQYTGLKDKNGVEIYEGDIVRISEDGIDWYVYAIRYCGDEDYPAFDTEPHIDCDSNGLSYAMAACEVEVIGNVYDNPELLERAEQ